MPSSIKKVILLIKPTRRYHQRLLSGIAKYASLYTQWAFYRPLHYREKWDDRQILQLIKREKADGIILRESGVIDKIMKMSLPVLAWPYLQKQIDGAINIGADRKAIGEMAADYFLERGFEYFAACGFHSWIWSDERLQGFQDRVTAYNKKLFVYTPKKTRSTRENDMNQIAIWLQSLPKPLALMASNDDRGEQVIEACKLANIRVPDDVAIMGVDNDELICELSHPSLTSIDLTIEKGGFEAAQKLDQWMRGNKPEDLNVFIRPTQIVERQSTNIIAIDDACLSKAIQFIHQNAKNPTTVDQVAHQCGLSRRVLEKRFKLHLERTVYDEIKRVRIKQIMHLLTTTSLPISEIADLLNFPDISHLSRFFKKYQNITPVAFRKQMKI